MDTPPMSPASRRTQVAAAEREAWLSASGVVHFAGEDAPSEILVVDDDPVELAVLSRWLSQANYKVHEATDGAAAWRLVADNPSKFDLILSDKNMPGLTGVNLLEHVVEAGMRMPVLLMSADASVPVLENALAKGSHDFLVKPLNKTMVLNRVAQTLEMYRNAARNGAYRKLMQANLTEMRKLKAESQSRDEAVAAAISKIEAPIVGITASLANIIASPELKDTALKKSLEDVLRKLVGDLYQPSFERVRAKLDSVALSLIQSYAPTEAQSGSASGSRKASLALGYESSPKELVTLYQLDSCNFNCWNYPQDELMPMLHSMIMFWSTPDFPLDSNKLMAFLEEARRNYRDNPYHSFVHAFDVTQTMFCLLTTYGAVDTFQLTTLETVATMIASVCHDIDHPAVNNKFLVATNHKLALLYNDRAVLENHHAARTFELLRGEKTNFLPRMEEATYRDLRNMIITCILSTDMGGHFQLVTKLEQRVTAVDVRQNAERLLLMEILVHAADLSNVAKPWEQSYKWSSAVSAEFFQQGDRELAAGLPVEPFMDRSKSSVEKNTANFIKYVVHKFYTLLAALLPRTAPMVAQMNDNLARFNKLVEAESSGSGDK